jgi:NTE family protein
MVHKNVALVLGGGGAAGQAWMIGVVAGLAEAGIDMSEAADLVIGTSSGATAAAWVRSGIPLADLYASVLREPSRPAGQRPPSSPPTQPSSLPMTTVFERMRAIGAAATSAADLRRKMGAFALETEGTLDPAAAAQRRALVASRLPRAEWPERPMIIVAVNAHTGELAAFDRNSGVDLADAVTASTALPGGHTHGVNGERYINGGVRSADNADLASGHANVLVLTPFSERTGPLPPGQFEGIRRSAEWGNDLPSQAEALRKEGSNVVVIKPDDDSRTAMGVNQMDPATRIPSAQAGFAQGKQEAARLKLT